MTGAATGLGEAIAAVLAAADAHVFVADIDATAPSACRPISAGRGHRADGLVLDVTDEESARHGIDAAIRGGGALDVLVNNAGSYHETGSIVDQTYESWKRAIAVNYEGVFLCSKPAAEHMVARRGGGAIINISSVDGIVPCLGTGYDSAKGALFQFTRSLAVDLAPAGVRVNCVAPGNVPGGDDSSDEGRRAPAAVGRAVGAHRSDGTARRGCARRTSRSAAVASRTRSPTPCCSWPARRRRT